MQDKLIILDTGDSSVGIMPQCWEIPLPFEKDDVTEVEHSFFKKKMEDLYCEYVEGRLMSWYTWERQNED